MDWFLYDNGLCHERVKIFCEADCTFTMVIEFLVYTLVVVNIQLTFLHHPERQHAEGDDNVDTEIFGDGGGGGDGSSGHSDSDMGGDGGVAIRRSKFFSLVNIFLCPAIPDFSLMLKYILQLRGMINFGNFQAQVQEAQRITVRSSAKKKKDFFSKCN